MKLNYFLLITLCLTLFACSTESTDTPNEETPEETEQPTDGILLKRIVETYEGETYTTTFTYDGNKLITYDEGDGWKNIFTYEDEKLVREDQFAENELNAYVILEYNTDGSLSNFREYFLEPSGLGGIVTKNIFEYNTDNTITQTIYRGDATSQTDFSHTYIITMQNDNIKSIVDSHDSYSYEYDDKNGVFKNIHNIEILNILSENEFGALIFGNTNNVINANDFEGSDEYNETYEYTYNDNSYPVSATWTSTYDGSFGSYEDVSTIEFFYE
ncbi:hypothetical protein MBM09_09180 [Flaviramulus sp. BrNp1-15]|uniref:hypothetical protein n=1 Tax=Flaviramulus sp. BrNp1-15 TaxID=2916754 RepID=UPI001EE92083|nr:hypothetical protein [Flaviramulus sp. BrNp1-15]ULC58091.1 hypothetical protein MBM09_09180 [Flaviramulus sp. BrNp1-15]